MDAKRRKAWLAFHLAAQKLECVDSTYRDWYAENVSPLHTSSMSSRAAVEPTWKQIQSKEADLSGKREEAICQLRLAVNENFHDAGLRHYISSERMKWVLRRFAASVKARGRLHRLINELRMNFCSPILEDPAAVKEKPAGPPAAEENTAQLPDGFWKTADLPEALDEFARRIRKDGIETPQGWELKAYAFKVKPESRAAAQIFRDYPAHEVWKRRWLYRPRHGVYGLRRPTESYRKNTARIAQQQRN